MVSKSDWCALTGDSGNQYTQLNKTEHHNSVVVPPVAIDQSFACCSAR